jgi:hypothetical protein
MGRSFLSIEPAPSLPSDSPQTGTQRPSYFGESKGRRAFAGQLRHNPHFYCFENSNASAEGVDTMTPVPED